MTSLPVLYSFRRCPYAMRARAALALAGIPVELREVRLQNKPTALLMASAKGTVPVLCLPDGEVLDESLDIMRWAQTHCRLAPLPEALARPLDEASLALIQQNDGDFKHWLDRYKYADRYPEQPMSHYRSKVLAHFTALEQRLSAQPFLMGAQAQLVDLALFPFVRQAAMVDREWFQSCPLPHLQRWLNHWLDSALFQQIMPKWAPWVPGDAPLTWPEQH